MAKTKNKAIEVEYPLKVPPTRVLNDVSETLIT